MIVAHIPLPRAPRSALRGLTAFIQRCGPYSFNHTGAAGCDERPLFALCAPSLCHPPTLMHARIKCITQIYSQRGVIDYCSWMGPPASTVAKATADAADASWWDVTFLHQNSASCLKFDAPTRALMLRVVQYLSKSCINAALPCSTRVPPAFNSTRVTVLFHCTAGYYTGLQDDANSSFCVIHIILQTARDNITQFKCIVRWSWMENLRFIICTGRISVNG